MTTTSLAARLNRLTPALSGKQRALLVIADWLAGRDIDPDLRNVPANQQREYSYFIGLLYTSNVTLGVMVDSLNRILSVLKNQEQMYALLCVAAKFLEVEFQDIPEPDIISKWKNNSEITPPQFLRYLEQDLKNSGLRCLRIVWRELLGLNKIWGEIAKECDGQDIRSPELITEVEQTTKRIVKMIEMISPKHSKRPPRPTEQFLTQVRESVEQAMNLFCMKGE